MEWEVIIKWLPKFIQGAILTLELVSIAVILGLILAIPLGIARSSRHLSVRALPYAYIFFFRGTPLLVQLFLVYYGLAQFESIRSSFMWTYLRDPFWCATATMTLHTAAYIAEILRGAIQAIPRGQFEGALSLGLHRWSTLRLVVLPQAMILALRPLGNELIVMIKSSAIVSLVTLFDLMGATRLAFARSFDLTIYLYAALIYLVLVEIIRRVWDRLEIRLSRHMVLR